MIQISKRTEISQSSHFIHCGNGKAFTLTDQFTRVVVTSGINSFSRLSRLPMFSLSVCEGKLQLGVHDGWEKEEAQIVRFDLC